MVTTQQMHNRIRRNVRSRCAELGITMEILSARARVPLPSLLRARVVRGLTIEAIARVAKVLRIDPQRLVLP